MIGKIISRIMIVGVSLASLALGNIAQAQQQGDPVAGNEVFKKCLACHRVGPTAKNGLGPVLNGIVGRPAGTYANFNYTAANKNSGLTWDVPTLTRYLAAPKLAIPDTKMKFDGLSSPKDIADLIAYLAQFDSEGNKKG